uniref:F-box domain-containing protein n=1 Tax=Meloidogyne incognita TaxID=6306 RepID=A0A914LV26_MELIC
MYVFPSEVQLDIFKFLNSDQLSSIQQTNCYFKNFINEYVNELARKEFSRLEILHTFDKFSCYYPKHVEKEPEFYDFELNDQLKKKWIHGIEKSIPMFLNVTETNMHIRVSTRAPHGNF